MKINFSNEIKIRVRYGETDQMGYCYYGNYAQYFEVGRVEALRTLGMSYKQMEEQGVMLPVSEFKVNYKNPALYDDELNVVTKITEVKGARLYFDYEITNEQGQNVALAHTILVFVDKTSMKPIAAPENFLLLMKQFEIK
jgi:acyl-CoA thioester hydrolase